MYGCLSQVALLNLMQLRNLKPSHFFSRRTFVQRFVFLRTEGTLADFFVAVSVAFLIFKNRNINEINQHYYSIQS